MVEEEALMRYARVHDGDDVMENLVPREREKEGEERDRGGRNRGRE